MRDRAGAPTGASAIVRLLSEGQPVFGLFSGDHTPEQGARMAGQELTDFVFYSLESGPFDVPGMQAYMRAMDSASGDRGTHPVALRIPPIRDDAEKAWDRVHEGLAAGAAAVVFPHVESAHDAAVAVRAMGEQLWPRNPGGHVVAMLIIEDQMGVERAREIVSTTGVSVVFAGPGDLQRAYDGDMQAVERAIETVLAACQEFGVPCGITAGVADIAARLEQGFQVIIVTDPDALAIGRRFAARAPS